MIAEPFCMIKRSANRNIKTSPEIIRLAVMVYLRFLPKLRNGEDFFMRVASRPVMKPDCFGKLGSARCSPQIAANFS